ncbi:lipopolysaccharide A protein [Psychromonas sp. psych-6C06]|nr:lipopolysaccharide A protein [Psychromonas sp. psych-6C06]
MKHRSNFKRFFYYLKNSVLWAIPDFFYRIRLKGLIAKNPISEAELKRLNYYNKLNKNVQTKLPIVIANFKKKHGTTYFFDTRKVIRFFPNKLRFSLICGDVTTIPNKPSFVKSRPINGANENSVLLKLNEIRHFNFINDAIEFDNKKGIAVWRGTVTQPHRKRVLEQFYNHPLCNIGQTKPALPAEWVKEVMTIEEQLHYKFILCIEGNDVATNLKWVMSSKSLCLMAKPIYETWFMEGLLVAGVHYVELKDDYSDLIEKIEYYQAHTEEAKKIIANANQFVEQFKDLKKEQVLSLLVAQKYFAHLNN